MADENHDDVDEPVIVGPEDEDAAGGASVSVAPFIDDDEPDVDGPAAATSKTKGQGGAKAGSKAGATVDDAAGPKVTRRVVTSKRVTPKGGGSQKPSGPKKAKGTNDVDDDQGFRSTRYTPPGGQGAYAQGPSPWWVPVLLFGFLIIGALIIMLNYMGVFGNAQNLRLVIGLAFILAGILTSTQYR
jgi:hypothetical protein